MDDEIRQSIIIDRKRGVGRFFSIGLSAQQYYM